jgi:hypothetical protein
MNVQKTPKQVIPATARITYDIGEIHEILLADVMDKLAAAKRGVEVSFKLSDRDAVFVFEQVAE